MGNQRAMPPVCTTKNASAQSEKVFGFVKTSGACLLSATLCLHSKGKCVFLRRAVKISWEINLGLDVGLEVGLGSPTQFSERSRQRVYYNEQFYFFFGATMEY